MPASRPVFGTDVVTEETYDRAQRLAQGLTENTLRVFGWPPDAERSKAVADALAQSYQEGMTVLDWSDAAAGLLLDRLAE